jgi:DNA polymerase
MSIHTIIDFETYYDKECSVDLLGVPNYVKASDAYMLSIERLGQKWCGTIKDFQDGKCPEDIVPDTTDIPVAANSNFDQAWWEKYFPPFENQWVCILDQAAVAQYPRNMKQLAHSLLHLSMDKSVRDNMCGKHYEDLSEEKKKEVLDYCLKDAELEKKCMDALPVMSDFEAKVAMHTRMMNRRGVMVDQEYVNDVKQKLHEIRHEAFLKIPWTEHAKPLSYDCFARHCKNQGVEPPLSTAKDDADCLAWMTKNPETAKVLTCMRAFRRANTLLEKVNSLNPKLVDGVLPLEFLYCGAPHTRRWSSRGFNIQNLDRDEVTISIPDSDKEVTLWTRKFFVPRPGKVFIIMDFSQIEPRCLWWLVGDTKMLDLVRSGFGIYEAHARASMGWKGGKLKDESPDLYRLAKARVLGLGYGCGGPKFQVVAAKMAGLTLSREECEAAVKSFRKENPKIVGNWYMYDQYIKQLVREPNKTLELGMPTGESLLHWDVKQEDRVVGESAWRKYSSYTVKGDKSEKQSNLWGGVITENITQRMARDVLALKVLQLEEAGFPVVFHAHDECILEVDKDTANAAFIEVGQIMRTPPEWAPDLPLEVEGGIHEHYVK